jgi:hypothetical protein
VTINSSGYVLTSEIDGAIVCKSFLDGKPQIKLALNEDLAVGRSEALALAGEYEGGRGAKIAFSLRVIPGLPPPDSVLPDQNKAHLPADHRTAHQAVAQTALCASKTRSNH